MAVNFDTVREIASALPGAVEGASYGTPAFKVGGKFFCRLKEDGDSLVLRIGLDLKQIMIESDPHVFHTTPHHDGYPAVLVRLHRIERAALEDLLNLAWKAVAPAQVTAGR